MAVSTQRQLGIDTIDGWRQPLLAIETTYRFSWLSDFMRYTFPVKVEAQRARVRILSMVPEE